MTLETIALLFSAACNLYGYGCDLAPPMVVPVTLEWAQKTACRGPCPDTPIFGMMTHAENGVIFIVTDAEKMDDPLFRDHVVVHEMIHYLQFTSGQAVPGCLAEKEAHRLSDRYLVRHGGTPEFRLPWAC